AFVASPEMVMALAISGKLDFNPEKDSVTSDNGENIKLDEPTGYELPPTGFKVDDTGYIAPLEDGSGVEVVVNPLSDRLQLLSPFKAWDGKNKNNVALLIKVVGKCTTDHISMAGPWLKYRGHLDNISNNMLIGGVNSFNNKVGETLDPTTEKYESVPQVARNLKAAGTESLIVGDHNYGEGSSREHAAMEPRHLGVIGVLVKSFARIHETNLKKQGMLAMTFSDENDYNKIKENDKFNFIDLESFAPGKQLTIEILHNDGSKEQIKVNHTYNEQQIDWFKAGSALNFLRSEL
ncbi:MAG: aconitate hydratase, partial [Saprospiraceae bacterium]